jgi:hypothetical protein
MIVSVKYLRNVVLIAALFIHTPRDLLGHFISTTNIIICEPGSSGWTTGRSGFDSRLGQRIFPLTSVSRPTLGPTQPPVQWVPGVLSSGGKARPGRDADHSLPSSVEVVNE